VVPITYFVVLYVWDEGGEVGVEKDLEENLDGDL
jgi:hypothetical protein